ncbi:nucleotidyltransferase domain-containing protein [Sphingobium sp. H39-3-25]|uniref:nucleotidyltransferase domain-containing protein n=1 Tax=Sphingobium arseniciresistens TaxID=3030834 RepID=UPI0023BA3C6B|nr:nucleotidyltransferase domain-containing protein [Sphingobium arseniciresistens]|tara:strand:- start:9438 stop:10376 length:939 start_codon:yes stop_codon:yes gene_type:complete
MRTDLDHLPSAKQRELDRVVEMLFQGFREATQEATGRRKSARILKIILFGSYARGDWVDAPFDANQFMSDYDILVIVNQKELTDGALYWEATEQRLFDAHQVEKIIRTPVNFIVHTLQQVNDGLSHGRLLFTEIAKDGVVLYQSDDRPLANPKPKTPEQSYLMAKEYFEDLFPGAMRRFAFAEIGYERGWYQDSAFDFHQATEKLYRCVLTTFTFYAPRSTNIVFLRGMAEGLDRRLFDAWPRATHADRAMYQKLKDAYRKGQHSKHFEISSEQLEWLKTRIEILGALVHEVCSERIAKLKIAAETDAKAEP